MENNNLPEPELRPKPTLNKLILFGSVIVITLVSFLAIFIWRLAQGPLSVSFLTPYFEEVLSNSEEGYKARLNETSLTWDTNNSLLGLKLKGIKIEDPSSNVVANIPDLAASLNIFSLMKGDVSPKFLSVSKLKLKITRNQNGIISLVLPGSQQGGQKFFDTVTNSFFDARQTNVFLHGLETIQISRSEIEVIDLVTDSNLFFPKANMSIERDPKGFRTQLDLDLQHGEKNINLSGAAIFDVARQFVSMDLDFEGLFLSELPDRINFYAKPLISESLKGTLDSKFFVKFNKQNQLVIENLISQGEVLAQTDSPKLLTKFKLVSLPNSEGIELKAKFSDLDPESLFSINKKIEFVNDFRGLISGELAVKFNYLQGTRSVDLSIESNNGYMDLNSFEKVSFNYRSAKLIASFDFKEAKINVTSFNLDFGEKQKIVLSRSYLHEIPVKKLFFRGNYFLRKDIFEMGQIRADLLEEDLSIIVNLTKSGNNIEFDMVSLVNNLSVKTLLNYWPDSTHSQVQAWIAKNVTLGNLAKGELNLVGKLSDNNEINISKIGGGFDFSNLNVKSSDFMSALSQGEGTFSFDNNNLAIQLRTAQGKEVVLRQGFINFKGLDGKNPEIAVSYNLEGNLGSMLKFLQVDETELNTKNNLNPYNFEGLGNTSVNYKIPLGVGVTRKDIQFTAESTLINVSAPKIFQDKNFSEGHLTVKVNNQKVDIRGSGKLGGQDTSVKWEEFFDEKQDKPIHFELSGKLDAQDILVYLPALSLTNKHRYVSGSTHYVVKANLKPDFSGTALIFLDLEGLKIDIPQFDWTKPKDSDGSAKFTVRLSDNGLVNFTGASITGKDYKFSGKFNIKGPDKFSIKADTIKFGRNQLSGSFIKSNGGSTIKLGGVRLSLTKILEGQKTNTKNYVRRKSVTILLNDLKKLEVTPGNFLNNVNAKLEYDGLVWKSIELFAESLDERDFQIKMHPNGAGRKLLVISKDAGEILRVFGAYKSLIGGKLKIEGQFEDMSVDSKLKGKAEIHSPFRLVDAPIFAKLLSFASITAIPYENLTGAGVRFLKFSIPNFTLQDGFVEFSEAKASGTSIGVTAQGQMDLDADTMEITGSIAPLDMINSFLGKLPGPLGEALSGGETGGSVFAAEYKMSGPTEDPEIMTNPLSAITPGIFRKIFEILPVFPSSRGATPDWPDPGDQN